MSVRGQISTLAAWCETDSHLLVPVDPPSPAAQRVCDILAGSGWRPSQPLSEDLRNRIKAAAQLSDRPNGSDLNRGAPLTNAELSQRSVDILLREYYNMMQAQQRAAQHKSDAPGGSALSRVFLLFCPAWRCLDFQHFVAAAFKVTQIASRLVIVLSCFIIPLWLTTIRELMQHQQHQQAIAVAVTGLTCFLLADVINRHTENTRRAAARQVVTAATARQSRTSAGGTSAELLALRQASRTATTSNNSKQTFAQQQLQQFQMQHQEAGAATSGAMSNGRGAGSPTAVGAGSAPSYLELLPALAALQSALGIPGTAGSVNSRERLAEELGRVCSIMGVPITPDMTASPTAMAATIAQLKSSIGI